MKEIIIFLRELWKRITKTSLPSSTARIPESILDDDDLLRRVIFTNPSYVRPDYSVTSFAFTPRKINGVLENGISVDISRLTTFEKSIVDRFSYRLYSVKAHHVRQLGLECEHNPVQGNDAHAIVVGVFTKSISKKLANGAIRVRYPD